MVAKDRRHILSFVYILTFTSMIYECAVENPEISEFCVSIIRAMLSGTMQSEAMPSEGM